MPFICNYIQQNIAKDDLEYLQEVSNLLKYEGEIQELADSSPSVELQAFQVVLEKTTQEACSLVGVSITDSNCCVYKISALVHRPEIPAKMRITTALLGYN